MINSPKHWLTGFEEEVVARVRNAAEQVLWTDAASLKVVFTGQEPSLEAIELIPRNAASAPMVVHVDNSSLVSCFLGRHQTMLECSSSDSSSILDCIDSYVSAIVDGRYEEWTPPDGEGDAALGFIYLGDRSVKVRYNTQRPVFLIKRSWRRQRYEPYAVEGDLSPEEVEGRELLTNLAGKFESMEPQALWDRFTERRRSLLGRERTGSNGERVEEMRGPKGGTFVVHIWASVDDEDLLHIFMTAQSAMHPYREVSNDFLIQRHRE